MVPDLNKLFVYLLREGGFSDDRNKTPAARNLREARTDIASYLKTLAERGGLENLLAAEKAILQNDLNRYANSRAMTDSLREGLAGMAAAEKLVSIVDDRAAYGVIDAACNLRRNRIGGVPKDEARQFFKSHAARLLNQDKSRLDPEEKHILDRRKVNMRRADDLYAARQRGTLGLEAVRDGGRDLGPAL